MLSDQDKKKNKISYRDTFIAILAAVLILYLVVLIQGKKKDKPEEEVVPDKITYQIAGKCNENCRTHVHAPGTDPSFGEYDGDYYVYYVCMGTMTTNGYSVQIESVEITDGEAVINAIFNTSNNCYRDPENTLTYPGQKVIFSSKPKNITVNKRYVDPCEEKKKNQSK